MYIHTQRFLRGRVVRIWWPMTQGKESRMLPGFWLEGWKGQWGHFAETLRGRAGLDMANLRGPELESSWI